MLSIIRARAPRVVQSIPSRAFRTKSFSGRIAAERDERYGRIIERQLKAAIERRDKEEAEQTNNAQNSQTLDRQERKAARTRVLNAENAFFWNQLSESQRETLDKFGIQTFEQLVEASNDADRTMNESPYPTSAQLRPRLRHAHRIYEEVMKTMQSERFVPEGLR
ncbi:hypothetical protein CYLTODRAFT_449375 [Cylindrobasidium torrendii FP15055 ss-10]|uniref:Uncharacterized protein n=1 Tax=Cylindrobasidium torrendii FP15055 ss-10 TaxID=1314674 RepID=A0A0D7BQT5_9AGAR|nr:hypothetical protein CYLTODRAFT_449375 [Cylindrobasidium torrendii FP15055 ss-10]